nr:MAG TPA: hypothetical protein [Inoviridae sp.]
MLKAHICDILMEAYEYWDKTKKMEKREQNKDK